MKTVHEWFDAYSESHQNPTNKLIHWICVPAIMFSIFGVLWAVDPVVAGVAMAVTMIFYFKLSVALSLSMILIYGLMAALSVALGEQLMLISIVIFVVSWIFQFVGHKIEGKKPSFFDDLKFLLVGPVWCMGFLFRKMNLKY